MFSSVLQKDVLYPGTRVLADGRRITVSPADLANAVRQGNAMLRAGIPAPWCWEHNMDAQPAAFSGRNDWFAKGYFGRTLGFNLSKNERGPHVEMRVGLFEPDDEKQLRRVGTVSPLLLWDYVDDTGRTWPGLTIGHVASTPKPIQRNQGSFTAANPAAFSGLPARCRQFAFLGGSTMADEKDDDKGKKDGDKGNANGSFSKTLDLLGQLGVNVGDGVTDMDTLNVALAALVASGVNASAGGTPGDMDGDAVPDTQAAGIGPMVMSGLAPAAQKAYATYLNAERLGLGKRVAALFDSGRITKPLKDSLSNRLKAATLSVLSDGNLQKTSLIIEIEAYEKLPESSAWSKKNNPARFSGGPDVAPVNLPEVIPDGSPTATSARLEELKRFQLGPLGYKSPPAPAAAN